jgi:hypothetical protein
MLAALLGMTLGGAPAAADAAGGPAPVLAATGDSSQHVCRMSICRYPTRP